MYVSPHYSCFSLFSSLFQNFPRASLYISSSLCLSIPVYTFMSQHQNSGIWFCLWIFFCLTEIDGSRKIWRILSSQLLHFWHNLYFYSLSECIGGFCSDKIHLTEQIMFSKANSSFGTSRNILCNYNTLGRHLNNKSSLVSLFFFTGDS